MPSVKESPIATRLVCVGFVCMATKMISRVHTHR